MSCRTINFILPYLDGSITELYQLGSSSLARASLVKRKSTPETSERESPAKKSTVQYIEEGQGKFDDLCWLSVHELGCSKPRFKSTLIAVFRREIACLCSMNVRTTSLYFLV